MGSKGTGRSPRPARRVWAAALAAATLASAACGARRAPRTPAPPALVEAWAARLPMTHEPLSAVLLGIGPPARPAALGPAGAELIRGYLAALAVDGPRTRPDRFPLGPQALAYLVDAHIAWSVELGARRRLGRDRVESLRAVPFRLDGRETTLAAIADEIARRAPWEPRLALFLNPGWRGGPPLPECAVEAHALDWQLAVQAERCGGAPGFWTLERGSRRLGVSEFTTTMWGLPERQPARARKLLELVPPPAALRAAVIAECGASLDRCAVELTPFDRGRLFVPR